MDECRRYVPAKDPNEPWADLCVTCNQGREHHPLDQHTLRAVRDRIAESLPQGKLDPEKDSRFIVDLCRWFRKGGEFEIEEEA